MWYVADKPTGPWAATADVPAAVYQIPPSSPAYPVTQVIVNTDDDGDVESSYDGAYAAGMFIGFGVAYYGTGYYYPPYYYGGYYYPYYGGSYGHGSWYNPNTGGFGSRSVVLRTVRRLQRTTRATTRRRAAAATSKPPGTATSGRARAARTTRAPASRRRPTATTAKTPTR